MSPPGWCVCWLLLTVRLSACDLEVYEHDNHDVVCSEGLSDCVLKDAMPLGEDVESAVYIKHLTPSVKLCCNDSVALCTLCLVVDTRVSVDLSDEDADYSGDEETEDQKASVTLCYKIARALPTCKKVEFTVNLTAFAQDKQTEVVTVIIRKHEFSYSDTLMFYPYSNLSLEKTVNVPHLSEVCHQEPVKNCQVPSLNTVISSESKTVELKFPDSIETLPSVCIQYERNGVCQKWNRKNIPLHSVAPCTCFQVWYEDEERPIRSLRCPFTNNNGFKRNIHENVSVSIRQSVVGTYRTMLQWTVSAPCRLEGEVWPCEKRDSCRELPGFRQRLLNNHWTQNSKGLWVNEDIFDDIPLSHSLCIMVAVEGHELGEYCFNNTDRHRWNLLFVGVGLLVCLTGLLFYFIQGDIKKWAWSWNHGGFVKLPMNKKVHVVLLSPPDVDVGVSALVNGLGLHLQKHGFGVSVEQWSRMEQCALGPLPWLYSQLKPNSRVVLILTPKALEKAGEWTLKDKQDAEAKWGDTDVPQTLSPYSDVFMGSLCIIEKEQQLARVHQRFLLVKFDTHSGTCKDLPKLLEGLPVFGFPSQNHELLAELTVRQTERTSGERTQTKVEME
ncbi:interleukin-17 receptor C isoform X2 [Betta splendens]|uniref:Interleukin-17 receptor C isoform X2 n=1 Tax=Betta splendens TaxID=158456 RepID=A0A6P7MIJ6_BETSP|nr:interleukin-17 receptor C isoform X2 [Betta splendens]